VGFLLGASTKTSVIDLYGVDINTYPPFKRPEALGCIILAVDWEWIAKIGWFNNVKVQDYGTQKDDQPGNYR